MSSGLRSVLKRFIHGSGLGVSIRASPDDPEEEPALVHHAAQMAMRNAAGKRGENENETTYLSQVQTESQASIYVSILGFQAEQDSAWAREMRLIEH